MNENNQQALTEPILPPTAPVSEMPSEGLPERPSTSDAAFRSRAATLAAAWHTVPKEQQAESLKKRLSSLRVRLKERLAICKSMATTDELTPELELLESTRLLEGVLQSGEQVQPEFLKLPHVEVGKGETLPRATNLAEIYLETAGGIWSAESLGIFVGSIPAHDTLLLREVLALPTSLKLAQLEFILDRADEAFAAGPLPPIEQSPFSGPLHSLRRLNQTEWNEVLEPLVAFGPILSSEPEDVFGRMEEEIRNTYMYRIADLAADADASEVEVAQAAVDLARAASARGSSDPRLLRRVSHVGYYLFEEGFPELARRIGYHPPFKARFHQLLLDNNEDFYILGIFVLSLLLITALIAPLVPHHVFGWTIAALLLALLPATQGATDLVNNTVTALLSPKSLPKLDFRKGIPREEAALVVVPTLLLNENQVREMFEELEARYLANQDPNLHFGLLTDLRDSESRPLPEDRNELVELAVRITDELNAKYAGEPGGAFVLLHRHRIFNARQGVWMGWERKRGKLLDLNNFLLGKFDSFPVKAGPVAELDHLRYVITLDSDTQLPRGSAARMVGTMAHPLNQAIVDPKLKIVTKGYGILQPRVGVSVSSASRSRLAALYSGETGFDIYTRAVSDVYQDLFGEGIFTGKGIYDVSTLHAVLDRRFPKNALLSHDLIEGAYARAGLVTDIEVIDDYPSHHSAHTRRKHRWVRGDWQITRWLFSRVPDEAGRSVENPISTISRWKILDNLRRSLVEPITFLLLVCGWLFLPGGALYWTLVTLTLLLLPVLVQLAFNLGRALLKLNLAAAGEGFTAFFASLGFALLNLIFLPHQSLLAIDAIFRSLIRSYVTGRKLLEWETAAQAEKGARKSSLDQYLQASPLIALVIAALVFFTYPRGLLAAGPILFLWAIAPAVAAWLNASPVRVAGPLTGDDKAFLEDQALSIWRFYAEFGGARNHWLIPDNVEEKGLFEVRKLSPTNLGMLMNTRQAALELGFLTLPEFTRATLGTIATYDRLEKHRGHIYNWYDIETLKPIPPMTISAVDSGNLAASMYTLHGGALDLLKRPVFEDAMFGNLERLLLRVGASSSRGETDVCFPRGDATGLRRSVEWLFGLPDAVTQGKVSGASDGWLVAEAGARQEALRTFVTEYAPWLLPRFAELMRVPEMQDPEDEKIPALHLVDHYIEGVLCRLREFIAASTAQPKAHADATALLDLVEPARERLRRMVSEVEEVAAQSEYHANAMEYGFLLVESRQLLSIGYDGPTGELHSACYDLLASEARIASFLAVAKGDIPQQSWFRLDRSHVLVDGRPALLSWTGTMFEYLMPTLWMRIYPETLLARTVESALLIQREHVRGIPWGISESGFAKMDPLGRYGYQAWGVPSLALKYGAEDGPVISPYSTFLALPFAQKESLANLRRMDSMGWTGAYGMYEAADYTESKEPALVRSWMAHHQGMCLLAVTNVLRDKVFQRFFHANPRVRAAELLLHERPLNKVTLKELEKATAAPTTAGARSKNVGYN